VGDAQLGGAALDGRITDGLLCLGVQGGGDHEYQQIAAPPRRTGDGSHNEAVIGIVAIFLLEEVVISLVVVRTYPDGPPAVPVHPMYGPDQRPLGPHLRPVPGEEAIGGGQGEKERANSPTRTRQT